MNYFKSEVLTDLHMDWFDRKDNKLWQTWLQAVKDYREVQKEQWDAIEAEKDESLRVEFPYLSEDRK